MSCDHDASRRMREMFNREVACIVDSQVSEQGASAVSNVGGRRKRHATADGQRSFAGGSSRLARTSFSGVTASSRRTRKQPGE